MVSLDIRSLGSEQLAEGLDASTRPEIVAPEIVALQAVAVVDHVCAVSQQQLEDAVGADITDTGGSRRVDAQTLSSMLAGIGEFHSKAGGSAANTLRGKIRLRLHQQLLAVAIEELQILAGHVYHRGWLYMCLDLYPPPARSALPHGLLLVTVVLHQALRASNVSHPKPRPAFRSVFFVQVLRQASEFTAAWYDLTATFKLLQDSSPLCTRNPRHTRRLTCTQCSSSSQVANSAVSTSCRWVHVARMSGEHSSPPV